MLAARRHDPFTGLRKRHYGVLLVDPPWKFKTWSPKGKGRSADRHYRTMNTADIHDMPVGELAAKDCVLLMWTTWPHLLDALAVIEGWGFFYKTCGFVWVKVKANKPQIGNGYWTRANSEPCLLATRGHPRRLNRDVPQIIAEPRREHSRKPDCIRKHIERLVAGPYLELFARSRRRGWDCWGDELDKFSEKNAPRLGRGLQRTEGGTALLVR